MAFLLDTNIISETRRPRPHPSVVQWYSSRAPSEVFLSAVTIGEIHRGILNARTKEPNKAASLEAWLGELESDFGTAILPVDATVAKHWAALRHAFPQRDTTDLLIAATAVAHGLVVATRNVRDFQNLGVPLFNPFEPTP
ncbi:PIN domain-containing protein [Azospirillum sp. sgz302134]